MWKPTTETTHEWTLLGGFRKLFRPPIPIHHPDDPPYAEREISIEPYPPRAGEPTEICVELRNPTDYDTNDLGRVCLGQLWHRAAVASLPRPTGDLAAAQPHQKVHDVGAALRRTLLRAGQPDRSRSSVTRSFAASATWTWAKCSSQANGPSHSSSRWATRSRDATNIELAPLSTCAGWQAQTRPARADGRRARTRRGRSR